MMYDENEAFSGSSAAHVLSARGPSTLGWGTAAAQVLSAWPKIQEFFGIEHLSSSMRTVVTEATCENEHFWQEATCENERARIDKRQSLGLA